jgi:YD repeat-containing protein
VGQDSLVSQQNYFYENDNELLLPIAQETIDTKGNKKRLETQYLNDRAEHVIAPILNQKSYYNGSFQQELNQTLTDYKPTRKLLTNANGETIQDVEIRYQNGLNISQLSDKTSIPKSYTWGYNETLPIIEKTGAIISVNTINNSSTILPEGYETVDELLTSMENIANDTNAQNDWKVFNDNLRSNYNGFIKTYTYKSLVGITSFTDENGLTTFYEYDGFGRLIRVKDHHNIVLKSMTYSIKK